MEQIMLHSLELEKGRSWYQADELGAPFKVLLCNGVKTYQKLNGEMVTEIEDLGGLLTAVVRARLQHPRKLSGNDLKFVRRALLIRSNKVASGLEISPEHYSRCENGFKAMSPAHDKLFRIFMFFNSLAVHSRNVPANNISQDDLHNVKCKIEKIVQSIMEMKTEHLAVVGEELEFKLRREKRPLSAHDLSDSESSECDGDWSESSIAA